MRIVSLLPSTTEILFALGAGDDVVGVTFECDFPPEARQRQIVSTSTMPEGLSAREIDEFVSAASARGEDLYHLHADALRDIDPDMVVTQDLCAVCAIDVSLVSDAMDYLGCTADVVTIDPHTIGQVLDSIIALGRRTGREHAAGELVSQLRERIDAVAQRVAGRPRPRVMVLEWTDPPFAPGHWIPEMVAAAGGECVMGSAGSKSYRTTWDEVRAARPDVIVAAPCGYGVDAAADLAALVSHELPGTPMWAVDADAMFARPGPRIVDGIEGLAAIFHPDTNRQDLPTNCEDRPSTHRLIRT